ncbi:hypothetical protein ACWGQ5_44400 [Streptomyces sp. NPDC055722]
MLVHEDRVQSLAEKSRQVAWKHLRWVPADRIAQAEPLLNTPGKKKTSKPYSAPPAESLAAGAVLDIASQLLQAADPPEARTRLTPLVQRLRDADRALSTYLRRPAWISQPLRAAVKDNWPAGEELAA